MPQKIVEMWQNREAKETKYVSFFVKLFLGNFTNNCYKISFKHETFLSKPDSVVL
jgi:hypothetical protein